MDRSKNSSFSPRKKKRKLRKWVKTVLVLTAVFLAVLWGIHTPAFSDWKDFFTGTVGEGSPLILSDPSGKSVSLGKLKSRYGVLLDASSGTILAEKRGSDKIYPASLTKMMTVILSLESLRDITDTVVMPEEIYPALYEDNASMAGFLPGERVTYEDLLYGAMLPSGGECCLALSDEIAGSEEAFAERMNEKAKKLGMTGTHFVNSTGLHEADHYSTAEDMAKLLRYALQNEKFREIFTSKSYLSSQTKEHPQGITMYSTLWKDLETGTFETGKILGGKTGYTPEAGLCLASFAQVKGKEYLLVTAKAPGDHDTRPYHIDDALTVFQRLGNSL